MTDKKALEVQNAKSLPVLTANQSWLQIFESRGLFDDWGENITIPSEWVEKANATGGLGTEDYDQCLRSLVDPGEASSLAPQLRQALDRIKRDIKQCRDPSGQPLDISEKIAERIASLIAFDGVSYHLVFNEAADAFRHGTDISLGEAREQISLSVMDLREKDPGKGARPTFEHDEYARMARYVHAQTGWSLTAQTENRFVANGASVSTLTVNSVIESLLSECSIYDSVRRQPVLTSNKLINEVRAAMARQRPIISNDEANPKPETGVLMGPPAEAVRLFADERLSLAVTSRTLSKLLFQAWVRWCSEQGLPPGDERSFFKALKQWAGRRIRRTKRGFGRRPGYLGVAIQAEV